MPDHSFICVCHMRLFMIQEYQNACKNDVCLQRTVPRPTSVTTAAWSGPSVRVCVPGDSLDTAVMKFSIPQEVRHRYSKIKWCRCLD